MRLKTLEERKGVSRSPGESGDDLIFVHPPDLAGGVFHDDALAHRDLAVADERHLSLMPDAEDGGSAKLHRKSFVSRVRGRAPVIVQGYPRLRHCHACA